MVLYSLRINGRYCTSQAVNGKTERCYLGKLPGDATLSQLESDFPKLPRFFCLNFGRKGTCRCHYVCMRVARARSCHCVFQRWHLHSWLCSGALINRINQFSMCVFLVMCLQYLYFSARTRPKCAPRCSWQPARGQLLPRHLKSSASSLTNRSLLMILH